MNAINEEPEHREIEALLPWHAAGTLSPRDANRVEQALAGDRELARQYDLVCEELVETIHLNETLGAPSARAMERLFAAIVGPSPAHRRRIRKVDLRKLLHRVETAPIGSPELDSEFESTFCSVPSHVTRSIDAATKRKAPLVAPLLEDQSGRSYFVGVTFATKLWYGLKASLARSE
jgi:hypothetical protein